LGSPEPILIGDAARIAENVAELEHWLLSHG